jgi:meso-butanediol dehydrogenase/(S,S)-butanediol dehydrogenase/diacetyl reductase
VEQSLNGQVALVTGGGQGIGRAIALRLAGDGMHVAIVDLRIDTAERVAEEIRAGGGRALGLAGDVASAAGRSQIFEAAISTFGQLDVLVNNAGVQIAALPLDVDEAHWDRVMDVNAKAVYFCCQEALRHMLARRSGRIVNIASAAGKASSTFLHPVYNVSKAAVISITKTFAHAYATERIRVNCVCPGVIETPMQDLVDAEFSRLSGRPAEQIRIERLARVPMGRIGEPGDVAAVVAFLAGPDSRYMTGQALNVTGGTIMY